MNTQPFFIGRVTDPVVAHMLHMSTLDVFLVNKFLREQIKNNTVLADDSVVLIADQHLNAKPPILRLLKKNIEITGLKIAGVYGEQGAFWAETLSIPFFTGKPRMIPDAEALKMRTAILQNISEETENNLQVVTDIVSDSLDRIEQAEEFEEQRQLLNTFDQNTVVDIPVEQPLTTPNANNHNAQEIINFLRKSLNEKRVLQNKSNKMDDKQVGTETIQDAQAPIEHLDVNNEIQNCIDQAHLKTVETTTTEPTNVLAVVEVVEDTNTEDGETVATDEMLRKHSDEAPSSSTDDLLATHTEEQQLNFDFVFPQKDLEEVAVDNDSVQNLASQIETELENTLGSSNADPKVEQNTEDERVSLNTTIGICKLLNVQTKVVKAPRKQNAPMQQQLLEVKAAPPLRLGGRVRSGCRLQNSGDVIVEGAAHPGSEIIAGGDIHIYGTGGGRLMAGVDGDKNACIYINMFDAEIISIAGHYYVMEDHDSYWSGRSVKISLVNDQLAFEEIFVGQQTA